ncbi:MAG: agmatinase family protein [Chloroflexota bacterium]
MAEYVYLDTPPLFGGRVVRTPADMKGLDVVVFGIPWEGVITWNTWSGCELGPRVMRQASLRCSGFLPEFGFDVWESLKIGDYGDCAVIGQDVHSTFASAEKMARDILDTGAIPVALGGDHSVSIPAVKAVAEFHASKRIGVIQYDAHYDNKEHHNGDRLARNCPMRRIAETPGVVPDRIVQVGIRGPRNARWGWDYAASTHAKVYTTLDIRRLGIEEVTRQAIEIAHDGTDLVYVTVDSDILDQAYNPGGPPDPGGISSLELIISLFEVGKAGIAGADVVEIYPPKDPANASAHAMAWAILYLLGGLATRSR